MLPGGIINFISIPDMMILNINLRHINENNVVVKVVVQTSRGKINGIVHLIIITGMI